MGTSLEQPEQRSNKLLWMVGAGVNFRFDIERDIQRDYILLSVCVW